MKAIQIHRTGGAEVLEPVDLATPAPGPGEVRIRARAIGVNFFDLLIRTGRYRWMPKLPFVPGNELAGEVDAVGDGVTRLRRGQRVFLAGYDIGNRGGLYAEYALAPEDAPWVLPDRVDFDAAVALTNYQLAWLLMHRAARGVEAKTVVVLGAAGGVGSALIDVARLAGAEVVGVAGGAEKAAFVAARGAIAVDHQRDDLGQRLREITGGRGADIVFDHIAGKELPSRLALLAPLGMLVSYAVLGGMPETDTFAALRANLEASPAIRCFTMHTLDHWREPRDEAMTKAIEILATGGVKPAIAARLPLYDAAKAHRLIETRTAMGKVVLHP
ncbi:MAG: zinc-binding dehydrogenase [Rhodospirillaceae bacterium]|nr:zinc-binding dehydrogenase [Rhodospirillaceae bacterium]